MPSFFNYSAPGLMKQIAQDIDSTENKRRKRVSFSQGEILRDILLPAVEAYLRTFFREETIRNMPIFGSINLARRIIKNEASIYSTPPKRTFEGVSEEQALKLEEVYADMCANQKLKTANEYFKLQDQTHLNIVPVEGKLKMRAIMLHQLDAVPSPVDPEKADAYILNGYDRSLYIPRYGEVAGVPSDGINQKIGDPDDYQSNLKRMALWSDDQNFITDKDGNVLSQDTENPLKMKPFVEIVGQKDNEYFTRGGTALTDFTIQWNASISDLAQIVRMQGYSQAWFKGEENMIPEEIQLGPAFIIKLPINANKVVDTDFGFASPSPDLAGSIQFVEMILSAFLTSRGIDPKLVNTKGESSASYSSGLERLLAMVDMFAPARADFDTFRKAEEQLFEIVKAYINTYQGTGILNYNIGKIPDSAKVSVKFHEPEMIQGESEKLANIEKKRELGLMSRKKSIVDLYGVSDEEAEKMIEEIDSGEVGIQDLMNQKPADNNQETEVSGQAGNLATDENVQKLALNGAQVTAMVDVVTKVSLGQIPRESGVNIISTSFNIGVPEAEAIIGTAGQSFVPAVTGPTGATSATSATEPVEDTEEDVKEDETETT
jgi:hypothetical protein